MIQFFCPNVYYWEDVIVAGKFVLLLLACGLPFIPILTEVSITDARLRNPMKVRILFHSLLTVILVCCLLGLIFIPSAAAVHFNFPWIMSYED